MKFWDQDLVNGSEEIFKNKRETKINQFYDTFINFSAHLIIIKKNYIIEFIIKNKLIKSL